MAETIDRQRWAIWAALLTVPATIHAIYRRFTVALLRMFPMNDTNFYSEGIAADGQTSMLESPGPLLRGDNSQQDEINAEGFARSVHLEQDTHSVSAPAAMHLLAPLVILFAVLHVICILLVSQAWAASPRSYPGIHLECQAWRHAVLAGALDAIVIIDRHGVIIEWSPSAETMLGWSRQEAVGRMLCDLIIPEQARESHRNGMTKCLREGDGPFLHTHVDTESLCKHSGKLPVRISIKRFRQDNDLCFIGFIKDITDKRQRQIVEQEAILTLNAAKVANNRFLCNMSHELKTPLNGIMGMAQCLSNVITDEQQIEWLQMLMDSGASLVENVNDILLLSTINSNEVELKMSRFSLRDVLVEQLDKLRPRAQAKQLPLPFSVDENVPDMVVSDRSLIEQILSRILRNAIKFTSEGSVQVHVQLDSNAASKSGGARLLQPMTSKTQMEDVAQASTSGFIPYARYNSMDESQEQTHQPAKDPAQEAAAPKIEVSIPTSIRIQVTDTGIGMSELTLSRVFERFFQADSSADRKYGGMGSGLAICKGLIELLNGAIQASSVENQGTTISIVLPFNLALPSPPTLPDEVVTKSPLAAVQDNSVRIEGAAAEGLSTTLPAPSMDFSATAQAESSNGMQPGSHLVSGPLTPDPTDEAQPLAASTSLPPESTSRTIVPVPAVNPDVECPSCSSPAHPIQRALRKMGPSPQRARILVVDDNNVNQKVVVTILDKLGFRTHSAFNGQEALDMMDEHEYDVVLMDCQMPVLDGYEATRRLRAREHGTNRHITVIAVTANDVPEDAELCLAAGMDHYLPKPVNQASLLGLLADWMHELPEE
ncbi:response regulator receiver domain-containing protein [Capsaspora owczarzaki ATCC 30864]|uniref:Response regulator receiver domain-containing protein n=1 Tax=Capsaspora owczarzaki (strain ATCC 30864) TaxID=595528 RepID=A0A0D2VVK3_CAPO3|nr:response regulator receiver domain-containing protein [Capsaspora owczarzaki ATCC 30864]KJE95517.1 response regulator receiver domain-containing protein [Capsaspora owczarzaki ATCC 30864]|eukprot:XP_004345556.1 response regulator receiver domain-containing protein [Capsaspora owczarzaki ATCC 30864]